MQNRSNKIIPNSFQSRTIIGKGSSSVIYKELIDMEYYATKCLDKYKIGKNQIIKQIVCNQYQILKDISHQNIVKYYGETQTQNQYKIFMQYIPDGNLDQIKYPLTQYQAIQLIRQLTLGLQYLRKNKIIHRDIKPANILMKKIKLNPQSKNYHIIFKLADFGFSYQLEKQQNYTTGYYGTPLYLAPQIQYRPYNQKIDMWSLGITMYQLINRKHPYQQELKNVQDKDLRSALKQAIINKRIKCNSPYPNLNHMINRMLQPNPKYRITPTQIFYYPQILEFHKHFNNNSINSKNYKKYPMTPIYFNSLFRGKVFKGICHQQIQQIIVQEDQQIRVNENIMNEQQYQQKLLQFSQKLELSKTEMIQEFQEYGTRLSDFSLIR